MDHPRRWSVCVDYECIGDLGVHRPLRSRHGERREFLFFSIAAERAAMEINQPLCGIQPIEL
jgi:hypothetical protein